MHIHALRVAAFLTGAAVMVLEIAGSRFLIPYIGTSVFAWTSLIGVILASLSLGYFLGGRLADRSTKDIWLSGIIFLAGVFIIVPLFLRSAFAQVLFAIPDIRIRAALGALMAFSAPSILLGMASPFATRLALNNMATSGTTVGSFSALSTLGSILGTFVAGFYLIPRWGVTGILLSLGSSLIALAALLAPFIKRSRAVLLIFVLFGAASLTNFLFSAMRIDPALIERNTAYNRAWIFDSADAVGRPVRNLITNPHGVQTQVYMDQGDGRVSASEYTRFFNLAAHFNPAGRRALMIGGGAYATAMDYVRENPNGMIQVVEIDPGLTALAKRYFGLKDDPRIAISHSDGRIFLDQASALNQSALYDSIFVDAFQSCLPPAQLVTQEALVSAFRILTPEGTYIINLVSPLAGKDSGFLKTFAATVRSVFPRTYFFAVHPEVPSDKTQNVILVARKGIGEESFVSQNEELNSLLGHRTDFHAPAAQKIFTDDFAPVEYSMNCPVNTPLGKIIAST
jgi:spermidine synthase